ncbi:phosphatidylinositol-3-phosphate-binding ubiquitin-protein ligase [Martiniozyma asiatica (nom. inval.)]|nr:phosphatidylinositol-3-phosphate-binding ubiquitin-protein ligase [Martiniozyma asiatica]
MSSPTTTYHSPINTNELLGITDNTRMSGIDPILSDLDNINNINNNSNINTDERNVNNFNEEERPIWLLDKDVKSCPCCQTKFTFFQRRHHCRRCGKIFCHQCCHKYTTYIPQSYVVASHDEGGGFILGNLMAKRAIFRTCHTCYKELKMLKTALNIESDSESDSESGEETEDASTNENDDGGGNEEGRMTMTTTTTTTGGEETSPNSNNIINSPHTLASKTQAKVISLEISDSATTSINREDENECPVCGINLCTYTSDLKENHINKCLTEQEFGSPEANRNLNQIKRETNRMLVSYISKEIQQAQLHINEDNECVICLDDFHPGEKIGRLECLCCFHYECIKDWINKKGFTECPVHALHQE